MHAFILMAEDKTPTCVKHFLKESFHSSYETQFLFLSVFRDLIFSYEILLIFDVRMYVTDATVS